MQKRSELQGL